jgi:hypothetical protein
MLKTLALAFTTLLIDRFDWFVMGVMLTAWRSLFASTGDGASG